MSRLSPAVAPIEILLVEDNPSDVRLAVEALKDAKLLNNLHVTVDGVEALAFLRREGKHATAPRPGLILLDLNLPLKDGRAVLAEIRHDEKLKDIPVVVLTASKAEQYEIRANDLHVAAFMSKPIDIDRLLHVVQSIEGLGLEMVKVAPPSGHRPPEAPAGDVMKVLLVEDSVADARLVTELLSDAAPKRFAVTHVPRLERAFECLRKEGFNAIVLDLGLADSQGLETLTRALAQTRGAPIIVLTGMNDEDTALAAMRGGAQDYVVKESVTGELLRQSLMFAIERHRAQGALEESESRLRVLSETSFDGIVISEGGIVREANRGYAAMFGYTPAELIGKPLTDLVAPESVEEVQRRIDGGISGSYELMGKHRDGRTLRLEAIANAHRFGNRTQRVTALRDVTEKHNLEKQYRQAQKMEAVGRLAGGVAHDFNNLLTVITSYTSLLLAETGAANPPREELEEIRKAAESATTLTRQLLAFSRQQVLEPKALEVNEVVRSAENMLRRVIGEDIELSTSLDDDAGRVHADAGQLEQIIMNLAVNARDAMPEGGSLSIETANVDLSDEYVHDHFPAKPGPYVMLAVSDSGMGMDDETKAKIFEPFFTTKETGKGTGLGLAMVYGIVKQSAGFIWVYSEPRHGTTFKVYLPRIDAAAEVVATFDTNVSAHGTETVLVVEDVAAVRGIERRVLELKGYTVLDAEDARSAIAIASSHNARIHLLLTDVVLPGMGGRELSEQLKRVRPDLKVLFTSGYTDDAIMRRGVLERGTAFMQKPFTPDTLARKVREVLDMPVLAGVGN